MRTAAIIQARSGSTRFPGKVLHPLNGIPALERLYRRLIGIEGMDHIIFAIPFKDQNLLQFCEERMNWITYMGHPDNVRDRVLDCARWHDVELIVDITADCPLIDPQHVKELVSLAKNYSYDYCSNIWPRTWPDGFDVQVFSTPLLKLAHDVDPEAPHVGWQIMNLYRQGRLPKQIDTFNLHAPLQFTFPEMRLTLDTPADAQLLEKLYKAGAQQWSALEIIAHMVRNPELLRINQHIRTKTPEEG